MRFWPFEIPRTAVFGEDTICCLQARADGALAAMVLPGRLCLGFTLAWWYGALPRAAPRMSRFVIFEWFGVVPGQLAIRGDHPPVSVRSGNSSNKIPGQMEIRKYPELLCTRIYGPTCVARINAGSKQYHRLLGACRFRGSPRPPRITLEQVCPAPPIAAMSVTQYTQG